MRVRIRRLADQLQHLGWPAALAVGYFVRPASWLGLDWSPASARTLIADAFLVPPFLAPAIGAWLVARRPGTGTGARRAWRLVGASYFLLFVANVVWFVSDLAYQHTLIQAGRWLVVASYPPLLAGLFLFPAAPRRTAVRVRLALDIGSVVLAAGLIVWYV